MQKSDITPRTTPLVGRLEEPLRGSRPDVPISARSVIVEFTVGSDELPQ